jgi:uncharacterized NAD(P)/FAD-binding protein YdhS
LTGNEKFVKLVPTAKVIHFSTLRYFHQHKLKADQNISIKNDRNVYPSVFVFFDYFCTKIKPITDEGRQKSIDELRYE